MQQEGLKHLDIELDVLEAEVLSHRHVVDKTADVTARVVLHEQLEFSCAFCGVVRKSMLIGKSVRIRDTPLPPTPTPTTSRARRAPSYCHN